MKDGQNKPIVTVLLGALWLAVVFASIFLVLKRREEYGAYVYIAPCMAVFMLIIFVTSFATLRPCSAKLATQGEEESSFATKHEFASRRLAVIPTPSACGARHGLDNPCHTRMLHYTADERGRVAPLTRS